MLSNKVVVLVIVMASIIIMGCQNEPHTILHQYQSLPPKGWDTQNTLSFNLDSVGHSGEYELELEVRSTRDIQFQKIYIVVEQHLKSPLFNSRDTVGIELTDGMGNLEGDGLYLYTTTATLSHPVSLHRGQHGTVVLSHIMRRNQLLGIKDVGIKITEN